MRRLIGDSIFEFRGLSVEEDIILAARVARVKKDELTGQLTFIPCQGNPRQMSAAQFNNGEVVQMK